MSDVFENLAKADFSLPALQPAQLHVLPGKMAKKIEVYIGTEGWNNKFLAAKLYPPKTKHENYLQFYAEHFNSVEVVSTKFGLPKKEALSQWFKSTPQHFKFSFKIPQYISHKRNFNNDEVLGDMANFIDLLQHLEHKIGAICFSLPAAFSPKRMPELFELLTKIPAEYKCAVELRNNNFYEKGSDFSQIINEFSAHKVSTLFTDASDRRHMLHMHLSSKMVYLKIMGIRDIEKDLERINNWAERVATWIENGLETVYLIANEPSTAKPDTLILAKTFVETLNKKLNPIP